MGAFWADAENLFETASQAAHSGLPECDLAIVISPQGGIQMLEAAGWSLPALAAQHGARTVYRLTRDRGGVCLEGRSGNETCLLRSTAPAAASRDLLGALPAQVSATRLLNSPFGLPDHRSPNGPRGVETWAVWG